MTKPELVLLSHLAVLIAKPNQYLSNNQFKINMSHVVKELAVPAGGASPRCVYYSMSGDVYRIELPIVLTGTDHRTSSRTGFTMYIEGGEWTRQSIAKPLSLSHNSQENVRCVMGYIVNLTVILDEIFKTGNATERVALKVTNVHIRSGRRDIIHRDIRSFVTEIFAIRFTVPQKDLVLEKIIDMIRQYCAPPSG